MGSATTQARADVLAQLPGSVDFTVASELFAASRAIDGTSALSGALADSAAPASLRTQIVADVFSETMSAPATALLEAVAAQRWSNAADLVDAVEELAIRVAAIARPDIDIEEELFAFGRTIAANSELELALGSRLGTASVKGELVASLLKDRASDATALIVASLVQHPRERRVRQLVQLALAIVAEQRGRAMATVTSARELSPAQVKRLADALTRRYGRELSLNTIVDPKVVGGLRVQVADDVIDASVSTRLADLRQRLAG